MSKYPVIEVGDLWTADLASSLLPDYVIKSANETVTSSTTLQDDNELVTPTLAVGTHYVQLCLIVTSVVAIKLVWTNTGTMSNNRRVSGPGGAETTAADDATTQWACSGFATPVDYGFREGTAQYHIEEFATVNVTVAGAITLQWAQNVSNATPTTVLATSYWMTKQIA